MRPGSEPSIADIINRVRSLAAAASDPRNDGWTASGCKHDLYLLKCFIEDTYSGLPTFVGEEKWEQERLIQKLKQ